MKTMIHENERGLLFVKGKFVKCLGAGTYRVPRRGEIEVVPAAGELVSAHAGADTLLSDPVLCEQTERVVVTPQQAVIRLQDGAFDAVVPAGEHLFWKKGGSFLRFNTSRPEIEADVPLSFVEKWAPFLLVRADVKDGEAGKLYFDNKFVRMLEPGKYLFWANGTQIVVKPTTFKADEVRMNAQAKGGLSILPDEEYYMGEMMPAVNSMSGVGKFSATELRKQLSGKSAGVQPSVSEYASTMNGSCSPKDIETMLQLVYLNFTQPRFDRTDYDNLMKMLRTQLENAKTNPDFQMQEKTLDVIYGHNPRRQVINTEIIDKFDFEALPAIYKKLYPDANSFRFTFVGNIDPEVLKPLVEKYIGSIPASKKPMTFVDDKAYPVEGEVEETFRTPMQQPKVSVNYTFTGEMDYSIKNKVALTFLTQALNSRYLVSIREEKGGTYGVQVYGSTGYIPRETYSMTMAFDTNEEMADELCEIILKELRKIAEEGPLTEDIEKTREFLVKNWKNSLEQNGSWMSYLQAKYGSGLDYLADQEEAVRTTTNADVQALAKKILEDGNMVKVMMRPEAAEE